MKIITLNIRGLGANNRREILEQINPKGRGRDCVLIGNKDRERK